MARRTIKVANGEKPKRDIRNKKKKDKFDGKDTDLKPKHVPYTRREYSLHNLLLEDDDGFDV